MKYDFISDPGHGWLKVPLAEVKALGVKGISHYSYMSGGFAYLEEDCDARLFVQLKERELGVKLEFTEIHQDPTPIRDYPSYRD